MVSPAVPFQLLAKSFSGFPPAKDCQLFWFECSNKPLLGTKVSAVVGECFAFWQYLKLYNNITSFAVALYCIENAVVRVYDMKILVMQ